MLSRHPAMCTRCVHICPDGISARRASRSAATTPEPDREHFVTIAGMRHSIRAVTDDADGSLDPTPRDLGAFERGTLIAMVVAGCVALYVGAVGVICLGVGALLDVSAVVVFGAWFGSIALLSLTVIGCLLTGALWRRWWRGERPVFPRATVTRWPR